MFFKDSGFCFDTMGLILYISRKSPFLLNQLEGNRKIDKSSIFAGRILDRHGPRLIVFSMGSNLADNKEKGALMKVLTVSDRVESILYDRFESDCRPHLIIKGLQVKTINCNHKIFAFRGLIGALWDVPLFRSLTFFKNCSVNCPYGQS
jgi:hypothetical protein